MTITDPSDSWMSRTFSMPESDTIQRLKLLVLDVDGVLTDGSLYVDDEGRASKRFSIKDGLGIKLWYRAGHKCAIISGHLHPGTGHRFAKLGIEDIALGVSPKLPVFEALLSQHGLSPEEVAMVGDDIVDLPLLKRAGFAASVSDGHPLVREHCDFVSERPGGDGAVREIIEYLLQSKGLFEALVAQEEST